MEQQTATLKAGWGYWDTTYYPYGGCFRRASEDTQVVVIEKAGKYPERERKVKFADGRTGVVELRAMEVHNA